MRFYTQPHRFYAGIDLHARSHYLCVLDHAGTVAFHGNLQAQPQALTQAHAGRQYILGKMLETIAAPRNQLSQYAPRVTRIKINPEKIGAVIGPGGKMIRSIQESFYGRERLVGTSLPLTRYDWLVEALGGTGETIEDPAQLRPALERALTSDRVACLNVILDPTAYRREGGGSLAI